MRRSKVAEEYREALVERDFEAACSLTVDEPFNGLGRGTTCEKEAAEILGPRRGPVYRAVECRSAESGRYPT